ncbi:MAG: hypothetical protein IJ718_05080 [Paludibacteraceae bacterium]|nr:hypothetical protein [Paludibacteraceae bacterium]
MKKFFYFLSFLLGLSLGVQAQDNPIQDPVEAVFVQEFINGLDSGLVALNNEIMHYSVITLEGKDIICNILVDESQLVGGMSLTQTFSLAGVTEKSLSDELSEEIFSQDMTEKEKMGLQMLYEYGYKLYFRMIGNKSGEKMNFRLDYESRL